jgi:hypothetical protein
MQVVKQIIVVLVMLSAWLVFVRIVKPEGMAVLMKIVDLLPGTPTKPGIEVTLDGHNRRLHFGGKWLKNQPIIPFTGGHSRSRGCGWCTEAW